MTVPFLDLQAQNASIADELREAIDDVISHSRFILGPAVEAFEHAFAEYLGVKYCVGLNNGTSALHMALIAHDIGPGDEVITTPHTWISTSWAISYVGARPVYVDIDSETYNIDVDLVEQAITPRTKAILPVHLYGQAADVVGLRRIADKHSLILIEDAAQAHGAKLNGQRIGTFGHAACFSFYPGKNLGAFGEGGAVVTNDQLIAQRIRRLRDHAQDGRHNHVETGFNTRMEGLQGAVLGVKLRHLDRWNTLRRRHAARYRDLLAECDGFQLPTVRDPESHVWHLFVILVNGIERDMFARQLQARGIATGVHYPTPVPLQPAYKHLEHVPGDFPVAEDVMSRCVSLPMFAELTDEQLDKVAAAIAEASEPVLCPAG
jgi:dTDP-4-amino-4,6-dideoxygalactose transaminase